jgi:membrane protein required for colicin V production
MIWADWAIVVILTLSSVISLVRGFVKEALSLLIWIAALVCANIFSHRLEPFLSNSITTPSLRAIAAFLLVFVGVLLLGAILNFCVGMLVKATGLSGTDRLLGMVFGLLRGLLIVMAILIYVPPYIPIKNDPWFEQSKLIPYLLPYESVVRNCTSAVSRWVQSILGSSQQVSA